MTETNYCKWHNKNKILEWCQECNGEGEIETEQNDGGHSWRVPCPACNGRGDWWICTRCEAEREPAVWMIDGE